jgi:integrase
MAMQETLGKTPNNPIRRAPLTRQLIDAAKPIERHYRINDAKVRGLFLLVLPSGVKSYYVTWARNRELAIGKHPAVTVEAARTRALAILADAAARGTPDAVKGAAKISTFGDFMREHYEPWAVAQRRAGRATVAAIKAQFGDFYTKPLSAFTALRIEKFRADRLRDGLKASTVNRDLVRIRAALSKAVEWGILAEQPLAGVKRSKGDDDDRVRYLSKAEEKRLRAALVLRDTERRRKRLSGNDWNTERGHDARRVWTRDEFTDHLRPMVLLALNTGLRRGELFGLLWTDVDLHRNVLTVRASTSKGQRTRRVPLNTEARDALVRWRKSGDSEGLVFKGDEGARMTNINKSWAALTSSAKLQNFRFHDCRHHFASQLVMAGVDLYTVKELLGHSDFAMTQRYAHLAPEHKAAAVAKLGRSIS